MESFDAHGGDYARAIELPQPNVEGAFPACRSGDETGAWERWAQPQAQPEPDSESESAPAVFRGATHKPARGRAPASAGARSAGRPSGARARGRISALQLRGRAYHHSAQSFVLPVDGAA